MKYKIIILDLDDTLLSESTKISSENINSLKLAQEKGLKVVLASGRPTFAMNCIADILELEKYEGYIISYNGARIIDYKTKETFYKNDLTKEQIKNLYDLAIKYESYIHTYI